MKLRAELASVWVPSHWCVRFWWILAQCRVQLLSISFHHPTPFVITKDIFPMGQGIKVNDECFILLNGARQLWGNQLGVIHSTVHQQWCYKWILKSFQHYHPYHHHHQSKIFLVLHQSANCSTPRPSPLSSAFFHSPAGQRSRLWGKHGFLITVLVNQKVKIPAWYCLEDEAVMLFDSYFTFESKLGWHRLFLTVESTRGIRTLVAYSVWIVGRNGRMGM